MSLSRSHQTLFLAFAVVLHGLESDTAPCKVSFFIDEIGKTLKSGSGEL